ncbi:MAG TPA: hypothetical protein VH396_14635 [Chitinophagaceae bacterium]|jgi:hypothetical protein
MPIDLLLSIPKNLGYPVLKKIDPNTQDIPSDKYETDEEKLNQAAITAVLIAMYKYTRSNQGAEEVLCGNESNNWLNTILGDSSNEAIKKVADYAHTSDEQAAEKMEIVARQGIRIIRESKPVAVSDVKNILLAQKNIILTHLPAALDMGNLLNDETIDDRTNKMEGPVSSFMKTLGSVFSTSEKSKEDVKPLK